MPVLDGIAATIKLREESNIPIILITAKSEDSDKVLGLTIADDYVTKPFSPIEVLARVKSQLRRYTALGGMAPQGTSIVIGGLSLDDAAKAVTLDGEAVPLTPTEFCACTARRQQAEEKWYSKSKTSHEKRSTCLLTN